MNFTPSKMSPQELQTYIQNIMSKQQSSISQRPALTTIKSIATTSIPTSTSIPAITTSSTPSLAAPTISTSTMTAATSPSNPIITSTTTSRSNPNITSTTTTSTTTSTTISTTTSTPTIVTPTTTLNPINIEDQLELMVDQHLIHNIRSLRFELHAPQPKETVITFDKPWEGNLSAYYTIMQDDDDLIRLYYRGANSIAKESGYKTCYAESRDGGKTWIKPNLGIFEFEGSTNNNIIWTDLKGVENFTPFKDTRPGVPKDELYKAVGFRMYHYKLYAFKSADGIHWNFLREDPLLTYYHGKFDSQNIIYWNSTIKQYVLFFRSYLDKEHNIGRGIKIALSKDFLHWTEFKWLKYDDPLSQKQIQIYTNCIQPYYRSPKLLIGFPNRFTEHRRGYPNHQMSGIFDTLFMTSRDGFNWTRHLEAFMKPGPNPIRWVTRNNMIALGMLETPADIEGAPNEISLFSCEGYYMNKCSLRRYALRIDGFMSLTAAFGGGEFVTKPIIFKGNCLVLNMATSGIGAIRVELQNELGEPIVNYNLRDCGEIFGDKISHRVEWISGWDLSSLEGYPIRLRFWMKDCDLYSFKFSTEIKEDDESDENQSDELDENQSDELDEKQSGESDESE